MAGWPVVLHWGWEHAAPPPAVGKGAPSGPGVASCTLPWWEMQSVNQTYWWSAQCLAAWRFFFNFSQVVQHLAFLHIQGSMSRVGWPGQLNQNCFSPRKLNTARLAERGTMRESWRPREAGPLLTDSPAVKFWIYILLPTPGSIFFPPIVFSNHFHPSPSEPGAPKLWSSPQKDSCQDPHSQWPENKAVRAFMYFFCSTFCNLLLFFC